MSTASGRTDRRRRILNEGTRSAGAPDTTLTADDEPAELSRYAANEESVSFTIARRLLPHRRRAIFGVTLLGLLGAAALLAGHYYQGQINSALGVSAFPAIDLASGHSIARWASSLAMGGVATLCLLVFGLRRHRTDDVRGVYRWWASASAVAITGSVCVATGLHATLASVAAAKTGWAPMAGDAFWWIMAMTLIAGPIVVRVLLDLKHCVPAAVAAVCSLLFGGVMAAVEFGWLPESAAQWSILIGYGSGLLGLLAAATSLLCYSRRIVLEAGGAIKAPVQRPARRAEKRAKAKEMKPATEKKTKPKTVEAVDKPKLATATAQSRSTVAKPKPKRQAAPKPVGSQTQWTDGSDGGDDYSDDGPRRKLSKAERKRLRKLKARQGRAA